MKNSFKIKLAVNKMIELLRLETEANFKLVLAWLETLADSLSLEEKVEAINIAEGLDEIEGFLKFRHFLEDELQYRYFQNKKQDILTALDKIHNPENYPAESLSAKTTNFSERQMRLIMRSLKTEFLSFAQVRVC